MGDDWTLVEGHALDLIDGVGDLDLLATDPPYAFGGSGTEHAVSATVATVLRESAKHLRPGHWAVVFAASSWRSTSYMVESVRGVLEPVRFATWVKPNARSKVKTPGWAWASVNVILMRKGSKTRAGDSSEVLDYIVADAERSGRRAKLPDSVAEWCISPFVVPGGEMLDPFAGSGALPRAAARFGMNATGFEIAP